MRTRLILTILNLCLAIPIVSYLLNASGVETVSAAEPAHVFVVKPALEIQATSVEEVESRTIKSISQPMATFNNTLFDYRIDYPTHWHQFEVAPNVTIFKTSTNSAQVMITALGRLPQNELESMILQSLGENIIIARQSLIISGFPAERIISHSIATNEQQVQFFINSYGSLYVISGTGDRLTVEGMAHSFDYILKTF